MQEEYALAAGKGLKGAKAAKKTKLKKKNGLADVGSTGGTGVKYSPVNPGPLSERLLIHLMEAHIQRKY